MKAVWRILETSVKDVVINSSLQKRVGVNSPIVKYGKEMIVWCVKMVMPSMKVNAKTFLNPTSNVTCDDYKKY